MKKNVIVSLLLSIVCVLTSCTAEPTRQPPTSAPVSTPLITVQPAEAAYFRINRTFTDLQGNVIMRSDGENITTSKNENIQTNETAAEYDAEIYIGNKRTKKLHRPDCNTLPSEKNRVEFTSRSEAINDGYSPCGNCNP